MTGKVGGRGPIFLNKTQPLFVSHFKKMGGERERERLWLFTAEPISTVFSVKTGKSGTVYLGSR